MKTKKHFFAACLVGFLLLQATSCKENTRMMNKNYQVSSFHSIKSDMVGNVIFTQSNTPGVSAEGFERLVKNLIVEVEDGTLKLSAHDEKIKEFFGFGKKQKLTVYVNSPQISRIDLSGVGNLKLTGDVTSDTLSISLDGVGNLNAEQLRCQYLSVESDGVGNISLKGSAKSVRIQSENVGNINAKELQAEKTMVQSSGVGNIKCYASESLQITGSGVGNITYFGEPAAKNIDHSGVGKVKSGD